MSDNKRRIIDYDAFNDLPPNSWLIVDSEGQGTGKIAPIKIGATYEIQDGAHSFTLVGSNGYTHTVDIPYDSVQMSYADYQALTEVQKMDGTNRFVPDVPTDDLEPEIWQRVGRTPLTTVEKTISPAINELKGRIDDSDGEIEDIKSNLTDLSSETVNKPWTYAGWSYYGSNVTVNTPFTEAKFYICINYNNSYRVFARGDYETDLDVELINNTAVIPCGGYHITDTDHSYISATITKTSSGYTFSVRGARWGNMTADYSQSYIMVWVR